MHRILVLALGLLAATPAVAGRHHAPHVIVDVQQAFGGATLGVVVTELGPELRAHFGAPEAAGVLVGKVVPDSAAEAAGLKVGDVIVRMGGIEISNGMVLRQQVQQAAGGEVSLDVVRNGKLKEINAEIAEPDSAGPPTEFHWSGQAQDFPGAIELHGLGELQDLDGIRDWMEALPELQSIDPGEFDDLHLRLDDLEQQLLEMTQRMEQATERLQERLDRLEE